MGIFHKNNSIQILPTHIAFIIDGNGRWASHRGLPRTVGHRFGVQTVKEIITACIEMKIPYISFFTFSTENWKRPKEEIKVIFDLLREYLLVESKNAKEKNIRFVTSGDLTKLPNDLQETIAKIKEDTKYNNEFTVNLAINYGGRAELVRAFNLLMQEQVKEINEQIISQYLYTKELPDPDFIIRTSGECRTSNFMPYQSTYAEWYFPKTYWPDFHKKELIKALKVYEKRDRRYGGMKKKENKK